MVFFNCSQCGDTIKKKKASIHLERCRRGTLSCLDCGVEFSGSSYMNHFTCVSESQKYEKPGTVINDPKGETKQLNWFKLVQKAILSKEGSPKCRELLNRLQDFPNTPRKKTKFLNFVVNSLHGFRMDQVEEAWEIISKYSNLQTDTDKNNLFAAEKNCECSTIEIFTSPIAQQQKKESQLVNHPDDEKSSPQMNKNEYNELQMTNEKHLKRMQKKERNNTDKRESLIPAIANDSVCLTEHISELVIHDDISGPTEGKKNKYKKSESIGESELSIIELKQNGENCGKDDNISTQISDEQHPKKRKKERKGVDQQHQQVGTNGIVETSEHNVEVDSLLNIASSDPEYLQSLSKRERKHLKKRLSQSNIENGLEITDSTSSIPEYSMEQMESLSKAERKQLKKQMKMMLANSQITDKCHSITEEQIANYKDISGPTEGKKNKYKKSESIGESELSIIELKQNGENCGKDDNISTQISDEQHPKKRKKERKGVDQQHQQVGTNGIVETSEHNVEVDSLLNIASMTSESFESMTKSERKQFKKQMKLMKANGMEAQCAHAEINNLIKTGNNNMIIDSLYQAEGRKLNDNSCLNNSDCSTVSKKKLKRNHHSEDEETTKKKSR
ncbi:hypothetical protein GJ496_010451 [Pomphorhynchus laevis]|nr:hypothetical protein GJ496_010451 [Pomphorhynchus laevis]